MRGCTLDRTGMDALQRVLASSRALVDVDMTGTTVSTEQKTTHGATFASKVPAEIKLDTGTHCQLDRIVLGSQAGGPSLVASGCWTLHGCNACGAGFGSGLVQAVSSLNRLQALQLTGVGTSAGGCGQSMPAAIPNQNHGGQPVRHAAVSGADAPCSSVQLPNSVWQQTGLTALCLRQCKAGGLIEMLARGSVLRSLCILHLSDCTFEPRQDATAVLGKFARDNNVLRHLSLPGCGIRPTKGGRRTRGTPPLIALLPGAQQCAEPAQSSCCSLKACCSRLCCCCCCCSSSDKQRGQSESPATSGKQGTAALALKVDLSNNVLGPAGAIRQHQYFTC